MVNYIEVVLSCFVAEDAGDIGVRNASFSVFKVMLLGHDKLHVKMLSQEKMHSFKAVI